MRKATWRDSMTVYMDLDGTITDVFKRYCGIFNLYIQKYGFQITLNQYKELRQLGFSDGMILQQKLKINTSYDKFKNFKSKYLEKRNWLEKDTIIGDPRILKKCDNKFVLITQRNNRKEALHQIQRLELDKIFDEIVILKPVYGENCKYNYLKKRFEEGDYIIGDSIVELECARRLGLNGCFVKTGLFGESIVNKERVFENYMECIQSIFLDGREDSE